MLVAAALAALILWMALDYSPDERRRELITACLADRRIGGLSGTEAAELLEEVRWLASAAGVAIPVQLNERPRQGHLNVYTTLPAARDITHCDAGNAVYDARLDCIFIDLNIARPIEMDSLGQGDGVPPPPDRYGNPPARAFFRFVVAHELGHRQLHRKSGGLFDGNPAGGRRQEAEADDFAVNTLQKAYAADLAAGERFVFPQFIGESPGSYLALYAREGATAAEHVAIDLASMSYIMNLSFVFTSTRFAPFYQDYAHPTFLDRAAGLFDLPLESGITDRGTRARLAHFRRRLESIRSIGALAGTELRSAEAITGVTFVGRGAAVVTRLRSLQIVPYEQLALTSRALQPLVLATPQALPAEAPSGDDVTIVALADDRLFAWDRQGHLTPLSASPAHLQEQMAAGWRVSELLVPPQPSNVAVANYLDGGVVLLRRGRAEAVYGAELVLLRQLVHRLGNDTSRVRLRPSGASDTRVYFNVEEEGAGEGWRMRGVASYDIGSLTLADYSELALPDDMRRLDVLAEVRSTDGGPVSHVLTHPRRFVPVPSHEGLLVYLVSLVDGVSAGECAIWRVSAASPLLRVSAFQLLSAGLDFENDTSFSPRDVGPVTWVPGGHVIVGFESELTYVVEVMGGAVRTAFDTFAATYSVSRDGHVAVYMPGGRKCYVFQPTRQ